jgi:S1-C subfamily serine protease
VLSFLPDDRNDAIPQQLLIHSIIISHHFCKPLIGCQKIFLRFVQSLKLRKNLSGIREIILQGILIGLFIAGCAPYFSSGMDGKYDSSHIYVDSIDEVLDKVVKSIYRIETTTSFKVGDDISTLKVVGMAFSLDERHLLTAKHVTSIDIYQIQTPFGLMRFPISPADKVEETTTIVFDDGSRVPATILYRDEELDFALLKAKDRVNPPYYSIGNSADLRTANLVVLPSNFQTGLSIRMGYITQLDFIQYGPNGEVADKNNNIFGISVVVSEGDSGSPILLLRDGKFELGGMVTFIVLPARGIGYGLKINSIIESLKAYEGGQRWLLPLYRGSPEHSYSNAA